VLGGVTNLSGTLAALFECAGFLLVLLLMTPITEKQLKRRAEFETFLLNGFIDIGQLQNAIFARNPDMTVEEQETVRDQLARFNSFLESTECTRSIVAEMVIVNRNDLVYGGFGDFKMRKNTDLTEVDEESSEPELEEVSPEMITSLGYSWGKRSLL
jgi:hypothetical protein